MEWRINTNEMILIVTQTLSGALCPSLGYPFTCRAKSAYFIKKASIRLDVDDACRLNSVSFVALLTLDRSLIIVFEI